MSKEIRALKQRIVQLEHDQEVRHQQIMETLLRIEERFSTELTKACESSNADVSIEVIDQQCVKAVSKSVARESPEESLIFSEDWDTLIYANISAGRLNGSRCPIRFEAEEEACGVSIDGLRDKGKFTGRIIPTDRPEYKLTVDLDQIPISEEILRDTPLCVVMWNNLLAKTYGWFRAVPNSKLFCDYGISESIRSLIYKVIEDIEVDEITPVGPSGVCLASPQQIRSIMHDSFDPPYRDGAAITLNENGLLAVISVRPGTVISGTEHGLVKYLFDLKSDIFSDDPVLGKFHDYFVK